MTAPTLVGASAILLWSSLALLTAASGNVPPFELAALTFAIGGLLGLGVTAARGRLHALRQPPRVWLVGVGGLFGYHALYFAALRLAPPAQAGLIAYLWPLLIVVGSATLPGERLRAAHLVGAGLGFAGVVVLLTGAGGLAVEGRFVPGYALAGLRVRVVSLFGAVAPHGRGADRGGGGLLHRHRRARCRLPSRL